MKNVLYLVLGVILGFFLLIIGINEVSKSNPTCGGQTMSHGDRCVSSKGGEKDYDAQLSSDHRGGYFMIGIGGLMGVGSLAVLVGALVTRGKQPQQHPATPGFPSGHQPPPPPGFGAPPQAGPPASQPGYAAPPPPPGYIAPPPPPPRDPGPLSPRTKGQ